MWILGGAAAAASVALLSLAVGEEQVPRTGAHRLLRPAYLAVAVILLALAMAAWFWTSGQSSVQFATAWGLPGVWQRDCQAPVRLDNPRYTYGIENGRIFLRRDFGREMTDKSEITDVVRTAAGDLQYRVHFVQLGSNRTEQAIRQNVFTKSPDGRIRAVANKYADTGEESVAGGVRAADKNPTPWMTRCE